MSYLFQRLSFEVPFDNATYMDPEDISPVIPLQINPQPGFINWLFKSNASSLTDWTGSQTLTYPAGIQLSFTDNSVIIPASTGFNGLSTAYTDSNSQTLAAVIKHTGEASRILLGAISTTVGECISVSGTGVISHLYRNNAGAVIAHPIPVPEGLKVGDYIFIAYSRSGSTVNAMIGGASSSLVLNDDEKKPADYNVGVGNTALNTAGFSKQLEVVELLYRAAPTADLQSIYAGSKLRCLARGLQIK